MNNTEKYFILSEALYKETGVIMPGQVMVGLIKQQGEVLEYWSRRPEYNKEKTPPLAFIPDIGRISRALKCSTPRIWSTIGKLEKMGLVLKRKGFVSIDFFNVENILEKYNLTR